jgi:peroxiredoxin
MVIKPGDRMPAGKFRIMGEKGPQDLSTAELFNGKRVVLFSVPGAFTPTCTAKHLPGYLDQTAQFKAKGIDTVACMALNCVYELSRGGKGGQTGTTVQRKQ